RRVLFRSATANASGGAAAGAGQPCVFRAACGRLWKSGNCGPTAMWHGVWSPSPRSSTAVRGKSAIAELQLIEGCSWRGAASIHWGRPSYFGEGSTREQELADELGEPKRKHRDAVEPGCDAEQQVGDHCCQDLQTDRVVVGAEKLANVEMLLDPTEQQFDLPAALVEGGDLDRRAGEIVCHERDHSSLLAPDLDPPQGDGQLRVTLAGEDDLIVC